MKNNIVIVLIISMFTFCNKQADDYKYIVFELANNKPKAITFCKANTYRTDSIWAIINKNPKTCIDYLMTFKGHKEVTTEYSPKKYGRIGFSDDRITYIHNRDIRNDVGALHLICAIYYDNYFFSSDRLMYSTGVVKYNIEIKRYIKMEDTIESFNFFNTINNNANKYEEINTAWQLVEIWWAKNKNKSIEAIRAGERPFGSSSLYWIGEEGGKVNKNFPHKFVPCYDKSEKP